MSIPRGRGSALTLRPGTTRPIVSPATGPARASRTCRPSTSQIAAALVAVPAETQDVEAVTMGLESFCLGEPVDSGCHATFEGRGGGDVDHFAAVYTQEVVVVLGELLCQLLSNIRLWSSRT